MSAFSPIPKPRRTLAVNRPSNNPDGRPSNGLSEVEVRVRGPKGLLEAMARIAELRNLSVAEVWRQAARLYLGKK